MELAFLFHNTNFYVQILERDAWRITKRCKSLQVLFTLTNIVLPTVRKFTVLSIPVKSTSINLCRGAVPQTNKCPESRKERHVARWPVDISQDSSFVVVLPWANIYNTNLVRVIGWNAIQTFNSSFDHLRLILVIQEIRQCKRKCQLTQCNKTQLGTLCLLCV